MKVLITIKGSQTIDEGEPDCTEMTTVGTLEQEKGGWKIRYDETEATGMAGTTTTLLIAKDKVILQRSNSHAGLMILEKDRRHHCHYQTPYGIMDLGIYASRIEWDLSPQGGVLDFAYTIGFNATAHAVNTVHITVQEEKTSCPLS